MTLVSKDKKRVWPHFLQGYVLDCTNEEVDESQLIDTKGFKWRLMRVVITIFRNDQHTMLKNTWQIINYLFFHPISMTARGLPNHSVLN